MPHDYRYKIPNKIFANKIHQYIKKLYMMIEWDLYRRYKGGSIFKKSNQKKSINVIHHINRLKKKNHMVISIDAKEALDKTQRPFMI